MLDRMFLSNGIPVLRVWYVEVEKHPERIMSEVIRIYDSLGGERMRLRYESSTFLFDEGAN